MHGCKPGPRAGDGFAFGSPRAGSLRRTVMFARRGSGAGAGWFLGEGNRNVYRAEVGGGVRLAPSANGTATAIDRVPGSRHRNRIRHRNRFRRRFRFRKRRRNRKRPRFPVPATGPALAAGTATGTATGPTSQSPRPNARMGTCTARSGPISQPSRARRQAWEIVPLKTDQLPKRRKCIGAWEVGPDISPFKFPCAGPRSAHGQLASEIRRPTSQRAVPPRRVGS